MAESIAELFAIRAGDDRAGIIFEDRVWTWGEVADESAARASVLRATGLAGRHLGILLDNVPEYVFLLGAAALTGSVAVGINDTRRGEALAEDIRHTDCAVVLTDSTKVNLLEDVDVGAPIQVTDEAEWTELVESHRGAGLPAPLPGGDALFLLVFTSGSTGAPKAVRMTQGRALRMMAGAAAVYTERDVLYCSMPMFHTNALNGSLFPGLSAGASVVLKRRFSASAFLGDIRRHACTSFNYVGRSLAYILAQPPTEADSDNSLVFCIGAEASPRDRKEFRRRFGCYVVEGYTSSEGGVSINPFPGMPDDALGRPPEGIDVAIVDPTSGAERARALFGEGHELLNPAEAIGEIVRRDDQASFEGYYANEEAERVRTRDGWFWTGDLGYRDEEGTFYFAGRGTDWLRVDGENFAAGPVELDSRTAPRRCRQRRLRSARSAHRRSGDGRTRAEIRCCLRPQCVRRVLGVPTRPRYQVGTAVRTDRRGPPGHCDGKDRPDPSPLRAVADLGPDLVEAWPRPRVPTADQCRHRQHRSCVRLDRSAAPALVRCLPVRSTLDAMAGSLQGGDRVSPLHLG